MVLTQNVVRSAAVGETCLLLEMLLKTLVGYPEEVQIQVTTEGDITTFAVDVLSVDLVRIVGKGDRIVRALRTLLEAAGKANHKIFLLNIKDHELQ